MRIAIDGIIYSLQRRGGISRLYTEILPLMCDIDPQVRFSIFLDQTPLQRIPEHVQIERRNLYRMRRLLRPGRVWKYAIDSFFTRSMERACGKHDVWHSTYFTDACPCSIHKVVTIYDMIYEKFPDQVSGPNVDAVRTQMRKCIEEADMVISISETTRSDACAIYNLDPAKTRVIPLAPSDTFRLLSDEREADMEFILYIGNRRGYKNFDTSLKAYSQWHHRHEVKLVVVGSDWDAAEQQQIRALKVEPIVHLLTEVDDKELSRLYNQAIAFVYPSLYEGFGIPLLEAMSCGCTIVASDIPASKEIAEECAIFFDPEDVDGLVAALDMALEQKNLFSRVNKGLDVVKAYSWRRTAKMTLSVYAKLAN